MLLIKRLLLIVLLISIFHYATAEELKPTDTSEHEKNITFYAGINPLALIAFLPDPIGNLGAAFGFALNQEFGISLYGGMYFKKAHSAEARFSTGPANLAIWDTQLQLGYIWYPLEQFLDWKGGLSAGIMLRQFFWNNQITDYVTFNLTPELLLGWRFRVKSLAFDVRAGWNLASVTWSTMPHTKAASGWMPFPSNMTLTTGIAWVFN
jgi:hypothetical protein